MRDLMVSLSQRAEEQCADNSFRGAEGPTFLEALLGQVTHLGEERFYDQRSLFLGLLEKQKIELFDLWIMVGDHCLNHAYSQAFVGRLVFVAPGYVFLSAEERFDTWFDNILPFTVASSELMHLFQGRIWRMYLGGTYQYVLENFSGFSFPLFPVEKRGIRRRSIPKWARPIRNIGIYNIEYCLGVEPCCWAYVETKLAEYLGSV